MANVNYLAERAELLSRTRRFFDSRGFLETQTPTLCRDCVVDAYLDPITVDSRQVGVSDVNLPPRLFLQTSPESAMKRLLAAGAPSIYSIGPVFRAGEVGPFHNVEFTMLEWYERGGDLDSAIQLTGQYACRVLDADRFETITYRQAFQQALDFDPLEISTADLLAQTTRRQPTLDPTGLVDRDDMLDVLLSETIAPDLGRERPLILTDYPLSQAALATVSKHDPQCAARFELFVRGVEIANGYDELRDPEELLARYKRNNASRVASGRTPLETETTLVTSMRQGLPPCSGVALGLDRLLMLLVGMERLDQVMPFMINDA